MKKIIFMALSVVATMASTAWADVNCQLPSNSVYSAPLAQKFIGYIQSQLPKIQFNPSVSRIVNDNDVELYAADGTILEVTGYFGFTERETYDTEGNVTGCDLSLVSVGAGSRIEIDSVKNKNSGYELLYVYLELGSAFIDLGIHYPTSGSLDFTSKNIALTSMP